MSQSQMMRDEQGSIQSAGEAELAPGVQAEGVPEREERLAKAMRVLADRISEATSALQQPGDGAGSTRRHGVRTTQAALERRIGELEDEVQEVEAECEGLWGENQRLAAERGNLQDALDQTRQMMAQVQQEAQSARHEIRVMAATRGWRLLLLFRRCRDAILRRKARNGNRIVGRAVSAFLVLDDAQTKEFRDQVHKIRGDGIDV